MVCQRCSTSMYKNGLRDNRQRWICPQCNYERIEKNENILYIPDLHQPFTHKKALRFVSDVANEYKCDTVIFGGDINDQYTLSRYAKIPDSLTTRQEFDRAKKQLKEWTETFPVAKCIRGNHDIRIFKRLNEIGIPFDVINDEYNHLYGIPNTWEWDDRFKINGINYVHGVREGEYAHILTAKELRCSTIMCHTHSSGGVHFLSSYDDKIFGANAGCLIDDESYVFAYAKELTIRPVLGCIVVLNNVPLFIPME